MNGQKPFFGRKQNFYMGFLLFFASFLAISPIEAGEPVSLPPAPQRSNPANPAFGPGERLTYEITYMGATAGSAMLEVVEKTQLKGREVYHVRSTARSTDFVSLFYPVDDRIESYIDSEELYSHYIKINQHQGYKRREKVVSFDQVQHRGIQVKGDQQKVFEVPPLVQDSLSSLYYFRFKSPIEVGKSVFIDVHESEKNWRLEIRGLARERVTTSAGTFNTIKVKALVQYEGIFLDKGDVYIWFTEDEKRIPVMMKSKVSIGTITAVLSSKQDGSATGGTVLSKREME